MLDPETIYAKVGERAAFRARKSGNPGIAITEEDRTRVEQIINNAALAIGVLIGTIRSDTLEDVQSEIYVDLVPDELEEALILESLGIWCRDAGILEEAQLWLAAAEEQRSKYRFGPRVSAFATRTYRMS
jgi:hypothetical protein